MRHASLLFFLCISYFVSKGQMPGTTPAAPDTIKYTPDKKTYEFYLKTPKYVFEFGELSCDSLRPIYLKIINNTGDSVIVSYRPHDATLMWWPRDRYDLLKPGEFMLLRPECARPSGAANNLLNIGYTIHGWKSSCAIQTKGTLLNPKESSIRPSDAPLIEKKEETPKVVVPEKKEPPSIPVEPIQSKRAPCTERYKNKIVYNRDSINKTYEFNIYNKLHDRTNENDLFCWGKLTQAIDGEKYIFRFKNNRKYPMYITDVQGVCQNLIIKNIGKSILLPDSSAVFSVQVDIHQADEFYGAITIHCSTGWEKKTYNLSMCGYHPGKAAYDKKPHYQRRDSLAIYLYDKNQKTHGEYTMQITRNDIISYPKFKEVNHEFMCHIPYKYNDTVWYCITDKSKKVVRKGHFEIKDDDRKHFIAVNDLRKGLHTYLESEGPYEYRMVKDMYFIRWNDGDMREGDFKEVMQHFDSLGIHVETKRACLPYITMTDKKKLIELQNRLLTHKYKILLCPVEDADPIDALNGWGGGCNYYINEFYIGFNKEVTPDKAKAIFKQQGITDYSYLRDDEDGLHTYTFSIPILVDFEYIKTLDQLYDLPEVQYLEHGMSGIVGLD